MSEFYITFLQFLATMLISAEYYLNKKKIKHLEIGFRNEIKKARKALISEKAVAKKIYKDCRRTNLFRIIFLFILFYILTFMIYSDFYMDDTYIYFVVLIVLSVLYMGFVFKQIAEQVVHHINWIVFISFNRFLYSIARKKGLLIGLGFIFIIISFIGRFINMSVDEVPATIHLIVNSLFVFCLFFTFMLFYDYLKFKPKTYKLE